MSEIAAIVGNLIIEKKQGRQHLKTISFKSSRTLANDLTYSVNVFTFWATSYR